VSATLLVLLRFPPSPVTPDPRLLPPARAFHTAWLPRSCSPGDREDGDSASGPACVALRWCGRRVGGLGPGLTSDPADAARAVLRDDLSAGSQVSGTHRRAGL